MDYVLPELLVILFIVILIFGANRLPDLAKGIGKSIKNFKEASKEGADERPLVEPVTARSARRLPASSRALDPAIPAVEWRASVSS